MQTTHKLNLGLENLVQNSVNEISLEDYSEEGIFQTIKDWWAKYKEQKRLEKLEKNRLQYTAYVNNMFDMYYSRIIMKDLDYIDTYDFEQLQTYLTTCTKHLTNIMKFDTRTAKSRDSINNVLIKADTNKVFFMNKETGRLTIKAPIKKSQKFKNSSWSKLQKMKILESQFMESLKPYYDCLTKFPSIVNSLQTWINQGNTEDEKNRRFRIARYYVDVCDFVVDRLSNVQDFITHSMHAIANT